MNTENLYIIWNKSNDLGIPIIDEQHRGIVSIINSLYYSVRQGKGCSTLLPTLIIMEQYSIIHFETEQIMLQEFNYPDYEKHLMFHVHLKEKLKEIKVHSFSDKDPKKALEFLKKWWIDHINIEDRKYVKYIK